MQNSSRGRARALYKLSIELSGLSFLVSCLPSHKLANISFWDFKVTTNDYTQVLFLINTAQYDIIHLVICLQLIFTNMHNFTLEVMIEHHLPFLRPLNKTINLNPSAICEHPGSYYAPWKIEKLRGEHFVSVQLLVRPIIQNLLGFPPYKNVIQLERLAR